MRLQEMTPSKRSSVRLRFETEGHRQELPEIGSTTHQNAWRRSWHSVA
jgi:hypothetical protein